MENATVAHTSHAGQLALVGGELCLDFTNTVGNHQSENPNEHLDGYSDLVAWSQHAGILSPATAKRRLRQAAQHTAAAEAVFARALAVREALYRVFSAISAERSPRPADIDLINLELSRALGHARLLYSSQTSSSGTTPFTWTWESSDDALDQMLWPILRSAADLLTSERLGRVRECDGDQCGWLFVDTSKNHSRRWCSMSDCGNRAKVQRFYGRRRAQVA